MTALGVVGGSATRGLAVQLPGAILLQRHGSDGYTLPHLIDHAANMRRLTDAGCDRVLAIGSVGGLRETLGPGTFVCPDDFIALAIVESLFADERAHSVPGFDETWRRRVVLAWADRLQMPLVEDGIYWQSRGPRLETPAEVRLMASHADIVGMTIASEAIAAREAGLAYAAICIVDNFANGVGSRTLSMDELLEGRAANRQALVLALERLCPALQ